MSLRLCVSASLCLCVFVSLRLCVSASLRLYVSVFLRLCISASLGLCDSGLCGLCASASLRVFGLCASLSVFGLCASLRVSACLCASLCVLAHLENSPPFGSLVSLSFWTRAGGWQHFDVAMALSKCGWSAIATFAAASQESHLSSASRQSRPGPTHGPSYQSMVQYNPQHCSSVAHFDDIDHACVSMHVLGLNGCSLKHDSSKAGDASSM